MSQLPERVQEILHDAAACGWSGSRRPGQASRLAVRQALTTVSRTIWHGVGDARGIDAAVIHALPAVQVFRATSRQVPALVQRSSRHVEATVQRPGSLWIAFPDKPCPAQVQPSAEPHRCFCGGGSGTWASTALAVGRGVSAWLVYLPDGIPGAWDMESLGNGWWYGTVTRRGGGNE